MATYTWQYGSQSAGLQFEIVYDTASESFVVTSLVGEFDLNALWFSDGNTTSDGYSLDRSDNALNMNGNTTVWDGTTSTNNRIVWDSYLKTSSPGLGRAGRGKSTFLEAGESLTLAAPDNFDPTVDTILGIRATSVNGNESIKWADAVATFDPGLLVFEGFEGSANLLIAGGAYGTVSVVPSGTNGIPAASGAAYALLQETSSGPFHRFGESSSTGNPEPFGDGFTASVKVYLDPFSDGADGLTGLQGFEYSVSVNQADDSGFLRDFIFHVNTNAITNQLYVYADNNAYFAPRGDIPGGVPGAVEITTDGWYTFEHQFTDVDNNGALDVVMSVYNQAGATVYSTTRSTPSDVITNVNGNPRYGWFTDITVAGGLAVDDITLV
jgi:hypothetical protein